MTTESLFYLFSLKTCPIDKSVQTNDEQLLD